MNLSTHMSVNSLMIHHHMHAILICQIYFTIWNITKSAIIWIEVNYMKLNQEKCHSKFPLDEKGLLIKTFIESQGGITITL